MGTSVQILADSISLHGRRLTTFEVKYPRVVHSELLTHRMLSKNSASSRAIPISKVIDSVVENPYIPTRFGLKQKGMQPRAFVSKDNDPDRYAELVDWWLQSRDLAVTNARAGESLGLHKQIVNRLLESFQYITVVLSGTDWDNFIKLRTEVDSAGNPMADYPLYELATLIQGKLNTHQPAQLKPFGWHMPYAGGEGWDDLDLYEKLHVCVARCARVSYKASHIDADPTAKPFESEIKLANSLGSSNHWSPFEHVAKAIDGRWGNFNGFQQLRYIKENTLDLNM